MAEKPDNLRVQAAGMWQIVDLPTLGAVSINTLAREIQATYQNFWKLYCVPDSLRTLAGTPHCRNPI